MGAIIRLACLIKTKKSGNTVQNFTFQSVMNIIHCFLLTFVFSKLNKSFNCVFQRCYISLCHMEEVISLTSE